MITDCLTFLEKKKINVLYIIEVHNHYLNHFCSNSYVGLCLLVRYILKINLYIIYQLLMNFINHFITCGGERGLGFLDLWSGQKNRWNWYLTPIVNFGEVRRTQLAKSTVPTSSLVFLVYFQIFEICSDAKERVGYGKQREANAPIQSLVKLQPWFLSLRWKTCLRQNCCLSSCACSKGPALGQNILMIIITCFNFNGT